MPHTIPSFINIPTASKTAAFYLGSADYCSHASDFRNMPTWLSKSISGASVTPRGGRWYISLREVDWPWVVSPVGVRTKPHVITASISLLDLSILYIRSGARSINHGDYRRVCCIPLLSPTQPPKIVLGLITRYQYNRRRGER